MVSEMPATQTKTVLSWLVGGGGREGRGGDAKGNRQCYDESRGKGNVLARLRFVFAGSHSAQEEATIQQSEKHTCLHRSGTSTGSCASLLSTFGRYGRASGERVCFWWCSDYHGDLSRHRIVAVVNSVPVNVS